jgi:hypothetical protein
LMAHPAADHWVDVTDVFDRKIEALLCHVSQHPDPGGLPDRMRGFMGDNGRTAGLPEGRLAEGFFTIQAP